MSDPVEGSSITPGVKKQTRRFAPVMRGGKSAAAKKREEATEVKAEKEAPSESASTEAPKSTTIGTIRPDAVVSGRLQSINDGQKTRGGSAKMKFKPTVPLKRNKKEVTASTIDEALNKPRNGQGERGGRGGRGRGAGRGRGRGRGLIIVDTSTASGIFSLGPSAVARSRPGFGGGGGLAAYGGDVGNRQESDNTNSDMVEMFTSSVGKDTPVTFKHVSNHESDIDPVTLSQTLKTVPWMTVKVEKPTPKAVEETVKVKDEPSDETAMEVDTPPVAATEEVESEPEVELPPVYMSSDAPAQNIFALDQKHRLVCVAEEELLHFQLPTVLPKFEKPKIEADPDTVMDEKTEDSKDSLDLKDSTDVKIKAEKTDQEKVLPPAAKKASLEEAMANLELEEMPDGQIGKLIIYKSGKMKMKFGSILLDVQQATQSTFLENIMVVDHESEETKKAIELGHIVQKFVCVPNIDSLLKDDGVN